MPNLKHWANFCYSKCIHCVFFLLFIFTFLMVVYSTNSSMKFFYDSVVHVTSVLLLHVSCSKIKLLQWRYSSIWSLGSLVVAPLKVKNYLEYRIWVQLILLYSFSSFSDLNCRLLFPFLFMCVNGFRQFLVRFFLKNCCVE